MRSAADDGAGADDHPGRARRAAPARRAPARARWVSRRRRSARARSPGTTLAPASDRPGLDHRRVHGADGALGVRPGADRRRAVAGRLRGGRVSRLAARPAAAHGGRRVALRAAVRAGRRAAARRRAGLRARAARLPAAPAGSATGSGCSTASAAARWWPASGSGWSGSAGAVALQTPGARELREPIQRSAILRELNEHLPPSGSILRAFARFDPFPQIDGPAGRTCGRPTRASRATREVRAAGRSVVKVLGTACGLGVQGSGWVAADGVVVTNAHVVAGQDDTTVQVGGAGPRLDAEAIWFDSRNDLAAAARARRWRARRALRLHESAPAGHLARRSWASPRTAPTTWRPARLGQHRDRGQPGRLRARAGAPRDHVAARPGAPGQLGRARGRRPRARGDHDLRRHRVGRRPQRLRRAGLGGGRRARQRERAGRHRPLRCARARPAPRRCPRSSSAISCSAWARSSRRLTSLASSRSSLACVSSTCRRQ